VSDSGLGEAHDPSAQTRGEPISTPSGPAAWTHSKLRLLVSLVALLLGASLFIGLRYAYVPSWFLKGWLGIAASALCVFGVMSIGSPLGRHCRQIRPERGRGAALRNVRRIEEAITASRDAAAIFRENGGPPWRGRGAAQPLLGRGDDQREHAESARLDQMAASLKAAAPSDAERMRLRHEASAITRCGCCNPSSPKGDVPSSARTSANGYARAIGLVAQLPSQNV